MFWRKATVHFDLFTLYLVHLACAILLIGGTIYENKLHHVPSATPLQLFGMIVNLVAAVTGLALVITMPFELPSDHIKKEDIVSAFLDFSPNTFLVLGPSVR